ncbi:hypothetical protein L3556_01620 [Candidatus Synechococcus calcipolaris G9]|uniref:Uncharacterized protein n=1 Tax=Candidatus Synechococcus calcipolaris G9 TaxID=1497997 RepID=A0ABT6EUW8_9SYNE|nr:hypothetical protein [Candidatus Synechococcus calcipolaris]MDG2989637.1 hypothetical protein [Candidatus Synechococcus calcipolaris G9]
MSQPSLLDVARQGNPRAISLLLNAVLIPKQVKAIVTRSDAHLAVTLKSEKNISQPAAVTLIRTALEKLLLPDIEGVHIEARCLGIPLWEEEFLLVSQADNWNLTLGEMFESEPSPAVEPIQEKEEEPAQVEADPIEVIETIETSETYVTLSEMFSPEPPTAMVELSDGENSILDDIEIEIEQEIETFLGPLESSEEPLPEQDIENLEEIIATEPPLIAEYADDVAQSEDAELEHAELDNLENIEPTQIVEDAPNQPFAGLEEIIAADSAVMAETTLPDDGVEAELEIPEPEPPDDFQNYGEEDEPETSEPWPPVADEPDEPVLSQTLPQLPDPWLESGPAIAPDPTPDVAAPISEVDASVLPSEPAAMANEPKVEHSVKDFSDHPPQPTPPPATDLSTADAGIPQEQPLSVTPSGDITDEAAAEPALDSPNDSQDMDSPFEGVKFTVPTIEKVSRDGEAKVAGVAGMVMGLGFCATGLGSVIGLPMVVGGMWMLGDEEVLRGECPHCGQSLKVPLGKLWRFSCPSCQGLIQIKNGKFYAKAEF